tara:strand:- start:28213 stop:29787 length:1575 start_codon:yes stop_codon:yes gene_type:complete
MAITITIQASSDAIMTEDGANNGTALADSDLRKAYGLPNQYVGSDQKLYFVDYPRWDTVKEAMDGGVIENYDSGAPQNTAQSHQMPMSEENNDITLIARGQHRPPTTTAFQLRCNSISHDVSDNTAISPLPGVDNATGSKQDSGTPGQLHNIVIALGMRTESIKLEGVLVDDGEISASNPRKQVLLNIARLQYFKTGRSNSGNRWGGQAGGPLNPRSYTCLTIYDQELNALQGQNSSGENWVVGDQPSGTNLSYRGLIKSLSFRQDGGLPNRWFWNMEFTVFQNEHPQGRNMSGSGLQDGILRINRIRLVLADSGDTNNAGWGTGATEPTAFPTGRDPITKQGHGYEVDDGWATNTERWTPNADAEIEIRTAQALALPIRMSNGNISATEEYTIENNQPITIMNTNCTPKIDGSYLIYKVDSATNTFRLKHAMSTQDMETATSSSGEIAKYGRYVNLDALNELNPGYNCYTTTENDAYGESIYWDDGSDGYITFHGPGDTAIASVLTLDPLTGLNEDELIANGE